MSAVVAVRDLSMKRGDFSLELPSLELGPGEVVGLVGPNGAGKTTLIEVLAGFLHADRGEIRTLGLDPWRHPEVRAGVGFMSDAMPLPALRIDRLLRFLSGYYATWDRELVDSLLERFGLDPRARLGKLSRGQETRVRLVTAMAHRPRLLLLDEPATGLDLAGRQALLRSMLEVVADPERTVIISSHLLLDVERVADRLVVLDRGRLVVDGRTDALVGEGRTLEEAMVAWETPG